MRKHFLTFVFLVWSLAVWAQASVSTTSYSNGFGGSDVSDAIQTTTADGGISLAQANGELTMTLTNATAFKKVFEMVLKPAVNSLDLFNDAWFRMRLKSSVTGTLQIRLSDSANVSTGDHFSGNISLNPDNQYRDYAINFAGRIASQNLNVRKINRIVIFTTANLASGALVMDQMDLGRIPAGSSQIGPKSFGNDFTGEVVNDNNQTTSSDGGITLSQNNELQMAFASNTPAFRKGMECRLRPGLNLLNLRNMGILYVKIKSSAPISLDWRLIDSSALDPTGVITAIPGDNVYRTYAINFTNRLASGPLNPRKIKGLLYFNTAVFGGTITIDSLRLGREPGGSSFTQAHSLSHDFGGSVLDDDNLTIRSDGGITLSQSEVLESAYAPNTATYRKAFELRLRPEIQAIKLRNEPFLRIKIRATEQVNLDWRLIDSTANDNQGVFTTIPGDNVWRQYTLNFDARINAGVIDGKKIRGLLAFNAAVYSGTIQFDSMRLGKEPGGSSFLTTSHFWNDFQGEVKNDDNQVISNDGSISIAQNNGELFCNFNNSGNYQRFEFNFRRDAPVLDLSQGAFVRIRCRANVNLALLVRVKDRQNRFSTETSSAIVLIPQTNEYDSYDLNLSNLMPNLNRDSIAGLSIWNLTDQQLGAGDPTGTLVLDSVKLASSYALVGTQNAISVEDFQMYPNPAQVFLSVKGMNFLDNKYQIVNTLGQIMKEGNLKSEKSISISALPAGLYRLQIANWQGKMHSKAFIKL
jgi:hypothetical protein